MELDRDVLKILVHNCPGQRWNHSLGGFLSPVDVAPGDMAVVALAVLGWLGSVGSQGFSSLQDPVIPWL